MKKEARIQLECIIIKSIIENTLSSKEYEALQEIALYFCKSAQKAMQIMEELKENKSFSEHYFTQRVLELGDDMFIKEFLIAEKVSNVSFLLGEYERYILLDRQQELAEFLLKETKYARVVDIEGKLSEKEYKIVHNTIQTFAEAEQSLQDEDSQEVFKTGVEFLDTAFNGGLATGQLVLISGEYESGKTTLTTQIIENMSHARKVCFFCFEFTLSAYIKRRIAQPNKFFKKENCFVITDGYDIRDIKANILKLHRMQGVRIFLIDSQMRIENNYNTQANGEEKESEKFEILGKLAHEKDILIMLIIQTSKSDPDTPFKSKKGAHEASIIMHLENVQKEESSLQNMVKKVLKVKKNKQTGKHFKEEVFLQLESGQFVKDPRHEFKDSSYTTIDLSAFDSLLM